MKGKKNEETGLSQTLKLQVMKGRVLGVDVYRGYARLCDLAKISKADIFDQNINPTGTQRDLNPRHAKDAYNYVKEEEFAFWSEVFLCARKHEVVSFQPFKEFPIYGQIEIDIKAILEDKDISISRVDGNHRLHYAGGELPGFPALTKLVSFCLAYNLTLQQEIKLFRDINNNQRRMNTSHLDNIEARLTPEDQQKRRDPALYIAKKLGADVKSPLFEKIYEGGTKPGYFAIPLRALKSGIRYMFSQPGKLTELAEVDAQYMVIRNYYTAVKSWQPEAWKDPKEYLLLRGAVFWGICYIGATVIDRTLATGRYLSSDMLKILKSGPSWDWSKSGDFAGLSGAGGSTKIRDMVVREFADQSGVSIKSLAEIILKS